MFDDILKTLNPQNATAGASEGVVSKNIIESDASSFNRKQKVRPRLTSEERTREINRTTIFWETYYKIRGKFEKDKKGATKTSPIKSATAASKKEAEKEADKQGKGILGTILAIAGFLMTFGKPLLKLLGKILLPLLKKAFKLLIRGIKWLGGKLLGFIKKIAARIGKFVSGLFDKLKNTKAYKAFTGFIEKGVTKIKDFFSSVKNFFLNKIKAVGKFFKNIIMTIPGVRALFPDLKTSQPKPPKPKTPAKGSKPSTPSPAPKPELSWWERGKAKLSAAKNWTGDKISKGYQGAKSMVKGGIKNTGQVLTSAAKGTYNVAKGLGSAGLSVAKAVPGAVVQAGKDGVKIAKVMGKGAVEVGKFALNPAEGMRRAKGALKNAFKGLGKKTLLSILKIPVVSTLLESIFGYFDIKSMAANPDISMEELKEAMGRRVLEGVGGVLGGAALTAIVTAATGGLGAIAGVGTYLVGDQLGRFLAGLISDTFGTAPIGQGMLDLFPDGTIATLARETRKGKNAEMQDFIMQGGEVKPFSDKDQILGFKSGGAMDKLLDTVKDGQKAASGDDTMNKMLESLKGAGTGVANMMGNVDTSKLTEGLSGATSGMGSMLKGIGSGLSDLTGGGLKEEVSKSNHYLKHLVQLTAQSNKIAIASGKKGIPTAVGGNATIDKPSTFSDSRMDYFNSPYSINVPST